MHLFLQHVYAHAHCKRRRSSCSAHDRVLCAKQNYTYTDTRAAAVVPRALWRWNMDLFGDLPPPSENQGKKKKTDEGIGQSAKSLC